MSWNENIVHYNYCENYEISWIIKLNIYIRQRKIIKKEKKDFFLYTLRGGWRNFANSWYAIDTDQCHYFIEHTLSYGILSKVFANKLISSLNPFSILTWVERVLSQTNGVKILVLNYEMELCIFMWNWHVNKIRILDFLEQE